MRQQPSAAQKKKDHERRAQVVTDAVLEASRQLGINQGQLGQVLGVSPASVSRLASGERQISLGAKEYEFAVLLIRLYRSLSSILGREQACKDWLHANNRHLGGTPLDLIQTTEGLVHVTQYLDAMRGKL